MLTSNVVKIELIFMQSILNLGWYVVLNKAIKFFITIIKHLETLVLEWKSNHEQLFKKLWF